MFFWDYSGIGILGIDGICVINFVIGILLGNFWQEILRGHHGRWHSSACADVVVLRLPPIPDLKHVGAFSLKLKFRVNSVIPKAE